jgi:sugar lactone lactonase YvrE
VTGVAAPFAARCDLGEGPYWNGATRRLLYVDIDAGEVHALDPATAADTVITIAGPVSFALPVAGGTDLMCGAGGELVRSTSDGSVIARLVVEWDKPANRLNDGKADPAGRLWFGSMSLTRTPGGAALYRLDESGLRTIDDAITISNGLDWDVERDRMYYIDSTEQRIDVFSYDVATGSIEDRRPFVAVDPADGLPDGLTIDAEGGVWVALFRGGAIRRYDPDGALVDTVRVPTTCPTCPVFGGDDLTTMFVTTSRHMLSDAERHAQPLAGAILLLDVGVRGRPGNVVSAEVAVGLRAEA